MNITNIPAPRAPIIDGRTGMMSREWYMFFFNLFTITGAGTAAANIIDFQLFPSYTDPDNDEAVNTRQEHSHPEATLPTSRESNEATDPLTPANVTSEAHDPLAPRVELGTMALQQADRVNITGGTVKVTGGATLISTNTALTNGAAAALGTLTNAPAAGNPTKWVAINDNGTIRYIPTW